MGIPRFSGYINFWQFNIETVFELVHNLAQRLELNPETKEYFEDQ